MTVVASASMVMQVYGAGVMVQGSWCRGHGAGVMVQTNGASLQYMVQVYGDWGHRQSLPGGSDKSSLHLPVRGLPLPQAHLQTPEAGPHQAGHTGLASRLAPGTHHVYPCYAMSCMTIIIRNEIQSILKQLLIESTKRLFVESTVKQVFSPALH